MKPLTYYIDKLITAAYVASLIGGVLVCTSYDTNAAEENKRSVNIRCVADASGNTSYMTAEDFLIGGERPADKEGINRYLENLKRNGLGENADPGEDADPDMNETFEDASASNDETAGETENAEASDEATDEEPDEPELKIDRDDWRLILVNKQNPVPESFEVNLANINDTMSADARIISHIYEMIEAASDDGVDLMICSAYRSYERQQTLFNNKINNLMADGMTYLEAYKVGSMNVTVPGTSEHHLGLALDILTGSYTKMDDGFGETKAGIWLAENAPEYGFILRYPQGKEEITGIVYEPWHFRYVGKEYAKDITEKGVCLEEYLKGEY